MISKHEHDLSIGHLYLPTTNRLGSRMSRLRLQSIQSEVTIPAIRPFKSIEDADLEPPSSEKGFEIEDNFFETTAAGHLLTTDSIWFVVPALQQKWKLLSFVSGFANSASST